MSREVIIRRVDRFGRILLPSEWRTKYMKKSRLVAIRIENKKIIIEPIETADLTEFFDSIEVDVEPEEFEDYNKLKKISVRW